MPLRELGNPKGINIWAMKPETAGALGNNPMAVAPHAPPQTPKFVNALTHAAQGVASAFMAPGNALMGNYPLQVTPSGMVDPYSSMIPDAANLTGVISLAPAGIPVSGQVLRMGAGAMPSAEIPSGLLDLSKHAPYLYRETDAEGLNTIQHGNLSDPWTGQKQLYWSDNPDLAIGQGNNSGVLIRMKTDGVGGKINTKPALSFTSKAGNGTEFVTSHGVNFNNIDQIEFKKALGRSAFERAAHNWMEGLADAGVFTKTEKPNGGAIYMRNAIQPTAQQPIPLTQAGPLTAPIQNPLLGQIGAAPAEANSLGMGLRAPAPNVLPMDEASRLARAKESGFRTNMPVYHGTDQSFEAFDPTKGGSTTGAAPSQQGAAWVSLDPETGNEFADLAAKAHGGSPQVYPLLHRAAKPALVDLDGTETNLEIAGALRDAFEAGHDAVMFRNYTTPGGQMGKKIIVVKDPSQLRSMFAAFDTGKLKSSDLLASLATAGAIGFGALANPQAKPTTQPKTQNPLLSQIGT